MSFPILPWRPILFAPVFPAATFDSLPDRKRLYYGGMETRAHQTQSGGPPSSRGEVEAGAGNSGRARKRRGHKIARRSVSLLPSLSPNRAVLSSRKCMKT